MTKSRYITQQVGDRVAVLRVTRHYPRGLLMVKCRTYAIADDLIERQVAEDNANRRERVADYLADRAARPAPAPIVDPNQLCLFA